MSQSLKDAASLHTDKDEMKVISPTVKSSDETGQKMIKLVINHMMSQPRGYQKT